MYSLSGESQGPLASVRLAVACWTEQGARKGAFACMTSLFLPLPVEVGRRCAPRHSRLAQTSLIA